jgi:putative membrane-bound dehydrogenase-like protein
VPPTEPTNALATFRIKPGFRIELAAAEPLVIDPIALSFDEDGRLYVVEMRDYSERRPERLGRLRLLEDTNGDGRFDKSTVFARDLAWPTAVICWDGGVFVGATPDILYLKDTNGDGVAEVREIVFTGFAADYAPFETNKLNVQALMNSFNWSLDNRIHGATSFSGGKVKRFDSPFVRDWLKRTGVPEAGKAALPRSPDLPSSATGVAKNLNGEASSPYPELELRGRDFSFDPRTLEMRAESGGGQHGLSFDNRGRKYVCSNSSHIQTLMYEERYAARNPYYSMPRALVDIAVDGGAAPVFRISPDEPWRVLRTQWRVAGLVPGPVEGGGRPSGYFTGATGVTIYRGDAFGEEFVGDAFVGDAGGNLVHRKKIRPDGVGVRAERPADEQKVEFLASTDNWFRPVQLANGPDGALYICDMYREVIEHPWSLPDSIKKHLDLNSGNDRGRIYRVVPTNFHRPTLPQLGKATTTELVKALESPNGWTRDTAARLLFERYDGSTFSILAMMAKRSPSPLTRLQALHVLNGLGGLTQEAVEVALLDPDAIVRLHALRFAENFLRNVPVEEHFSARVTSRADDPDRDVQYQLAFTLAGLPPRWRLRATSTLVQAGHAGGWTGHALLSSLRDDAAPLFSKLAGQGLQFPGSSEFLPDLARVVGARNRSNEVAAVLERLPDPRLSWVNLAVAASLADGLEQNGAALRNPDCQQRLRPLFDVAREWATNQSFTGKIFAGDPQNAALRLLGFAPFAEAAPILLASLDASQPRNAQATALASLDRFREPQLAEDLLKRWPGFSPVVRGEVLDLLLKRPERVRALLAALEAGGVGPTELSAAQQAFLRSHRDTAFRASAIKLLGAAPDAARGALMESYLPTLKLNGVASSGQKIFQSRCASCHKLGSEGHALGPDLATVKAAGREKLLMNILDPNREVAPNFLAYSIDTKDGDSFTGVVVNESASSVTLRQANGVETIVPRPNIASLQSQGKSLMPEGLEAGLSQQDMADLLEFILK